MLQYFNDVKNDDDVTWIHSVMLSGEQSQSRTTVFQVDLTVLSTKRNTTQHGCFDRRVCWEEELQSGAVYIFLSGLL